MPTTVGAATHLVRRRRYEDGRAIEHLEKQGHHVVQEGAILLALAVRFDVVPYFYGLNQFDSMIWVEVSRGCC